MARSSAFTWVGVEYYDCVLLTYEKRGDGGVDDFYARLMSVLPPGKTTHVFGSCVPLTAEQGGGYRYDAVVYSENQVVCSVGDEMSLFHAMKRVCRGWDEPEGAPCERTVSTKWAILREYESRDLCLKPFLVEKQNWCEHRGPRYRVSSSAQTFGERFDVEVTSENDSVQSRTTLYADDGKTWKLAVELWSFRWRHSGVHCSITEPKEQDG
jgi:hypothetical protein